MFPQSLSLGLFGFFFFPLVFCVLVRCTTHFRSAYPFNLSTPPCFQLLTLHFSPDIPPFPHSSMLSHILLSDAFFFEYVAYLVWHVPCATYAIYAFAFNVSRQKSFVCPLLDLLINCSHSRTEATKRVRELTCACALLRKSHRPVHRPTVPHGRKPIGRIPRGEKIELDGDRGDERCFSDGYLRRMMRREGEKSVTVPFCSGCLSR